MLRIFEAASLAKSMKEHLLEQALQVLFHVLCSALFEYYTKIMLVNKGFLSDIKNYSQKS